MVYVFDGYELDTDGYELRRTGEPLQIEPKPFALLAYLVQQRGRVVAKDELFKQLWPKQFVGDDALVYCIMTARKAVGDSGSAQRLIKTVHRQGYRFVAPVEERSQEPSAPHAFLCGAGACGNAISGPTSPGRSFVSCPTCSTSSPTVRGSAGWWVGCYCAWCVRGRATPTHGSVLSYGGLPSPCRVP